VRGGEVGLGDFGGILVSLKGFVGRSLALVTKSKFGQVAVVISLPAKGHSLVPRRVRQGLAHSHLVVEDL
jgi:hypothetical protein